MEAQTEPEPTRGHTQKLMSFKADFDQEIISLGKVTEAWECGSVAERLPDFIKSPGFSV